MIDENNHEVYLNHKYTFLKFTCSNKRPKYESFEGYPSLSASLLMCCLSTADLFVCHFWKIFIANFHLYLYSFIFPSIFFSLGFISSVIVPSLFVTLCLVSYLISFVLSFSLSFYLSFLSLHFFRLWSCLWFIIGRHCCESRNDSPNRNLRGSNLAIIQEEKTSNKQHIRWQYSIIQKEWRMKRRSSRDKKKWEMRSKAKIESERAF